MTYKLKVHAIYVVCVFMYKNSCFLECTCLWIACYLDFLVREYMEHNLFLFYVFLYGTYYIKELFHNLGIWNIKLQINFLYVNFFFLLSINISLYKSYRGLFLDKFNHLKYTHGQFQSLIKTIFLFKNIS